MFGLNRIPWRFYGVWLLPLGGLMGFAGYGSILYTYPVFFPVITKEFGWSAAVAATASSLARLEGGFEGPIVGWVLDKYGPRIVMFICGLMMGLGLIAMSWMNADGIVYYYIVFGVIVNLGYNSGLYTSSYKAVNNWWVKWRARAISCMILPTAIAGTFGPTVGTWVIQNWGWRIGLDLMGALVLVIFIPTSLLVRPKLPEYYGLLPDGDDPSKVKAVTDEEKKAAEAALMKETLKKQVDFTTSQAMKSNAFWVYSVAYILYAFGSGPMLLFVPMHLQSRGMDAMTAAFYAGLMMSLTYIGRFTVMLFGDIISPKWLQVVSWTFSGLGAFSLANAGVSAPMLALGYALFYGIGYGMAIPLTPSVRGWLFGRVSFGTIYGIMSAIGMIGGVIAPTFAGWSYDMNGNYYVAYTAFGATMVGAAFIFAFAKRPKLDVVPATAANPVSAS